MNLSRRTFFKVNAAGAAALVVAPGAAEAATATLSPHARGVLVDATRCVGCRACEAACSEANHNAEPVSLGDDRVFEARRDTDQRTFTVVNRFAPAAASGAAPVRFVKKQCMHCIEPACVSVCPVAALEKLETGPVVYHSERCIGCRYCMVACPFNIPKTQWEKVFPLIQKCDFCADRQAAGEQPACGEACPTGALIYGTRREMLDIARARLESGKNYQKHIYGETEAGGVSMLYLSDIKYASLGFPTLDDTPLPSLDWPYLKAVPGLIAVMVSLSTAIYFRTHRGEKNTTGKEK